MTLLAIPIIAAPSVQADADAAASNARSADELIPGQMAISVDAQPKRTLASMSSVHKIIFHPSDAASGAASDCASDGDVDWHEVPHTPSTGSGLSVNTPDEDDSDDIADYQSDYRSDYEEVSANSLRTPPPLCHALAARPIPIPITLQHPVRYMYADDNEDSGWAGIDIAPEEEDDKDSDDDAIYFSLPSRLRHRDSRIDAWSPYPTSTPPNSVATGPVFPDETINEPSPRFSLRHTGPSLARFGSHHSSHHGNHQPLHRPINPPPARHRQSPPPSRSPSPEQSRETRATHDAWRTFGVNTSEGEPVSELSRSAFSIRFPRRNADGTTTLTREHLEQQRKLQNLVGLLNDTLYEEARSVTRTLLTLTHDLHHMRSNVLGLRCEMEKLKEVYERSLAHASGSCSSCCVYVPPGETLPPYT